MKLLGRLHAWVIYAVLRYHGWRLGVWRRRIIRDDPAAEAHLEQVTLPTPPVRVVHLGIGPHEEPLCLRKIGASWFGTVVTHDRNDVTCLRCLSVLTGVR